ncbi:MAG: hypothetical protein JWN70_3400 [Planctomycetaceae bacterium]|nr:hypothetical protein [Planctomycetaceae bacterium]
MNEDAKPKRTTWALWMFAALMLLVAYVLSIGPAAWCLNVTGARNGHWIKKFADAVYAPVVILAESSEDSRRVLGRYVEFWLGI